MNDFYRNNHDYNPNKKREISAMFHDIIPDILVERVKKVFPSTSSKQVLSSTITKQVLNNTLAFNTQLYFVVAKNARLK